MALSVTASPFWSRTGGRFEEDSAGLVEGLCAPPPAWGLGNPSLKAFLCGGGCAEGRDRLVKANVQGGGGAAWQGGSVGLCQEVTEWPGT